MIHWYMVYTDHCQTCGHTSTYRVIMYGNPPSHNELRYETRNVRCDSH